ncbi:MAG: transcriptional repressor NrdR [Caldisericia bacterium]|nr:transcriptional repressor NrdR [Caldisericia bacterium]
MKCPFCNSVLHKVLDKRESKVGNSIRRRRECLVCGKRFTTHERIDLGNIMVIKKDRSRQTFCRDKIKNGILKSTQKRPVSNDQIETMIDSIESTIRKEYEKEVDSDQIGNVILKELKKVDLVAYIRFASVYKDFRDIDEFVTEIQELSSNWRAKNV